MSLTAPCSTLTILTAALGTAAPLESVTWPEIDARFSWACSTEAAAKIAKRAAKRAKDIQRILSIGRSPTYWSRYYIRASPGVNGYSGSQNAVTRGGAGFRLRRRFSPPAAGFIRASPLKRD